MPNNSDISEKWSISVPMLGSRLVKKQLFLALGLPALIIFVVIAIVSKGQVFDGTFRYAMLSIVVLVLLTYVLLKVAYGGKYSADFTIDERGIAFRTSPKELKKTRIIGGLGFLLAVFSRSPGGAAASYTSQLNQENFIKWDNIKDVEYYPKDRLIYVKENFASKIAVFCNETNYDIIRKLISEKIQKS
jgi:hypothetical protein